MVLLRFVPLLLRINSPQLLIQMLEVYAEHFHLFKDYLKSLKDGIKFVFPKHNYLLIFHLLLIFAFVSLLIIFVLFFSVLLISALVFILFKYLQSVLLVCICSLLHMTIALHWLYEVLWFCHFYLSVILLRRDLMLATMHH